jgi:putative ABC transport system permease protein
MKHGILNLIIKSVLYFRRSVFYQGAIVFILAAIITGSLLTGFSVRQSLKNSAAEHLGNTDLLISSGQRFFDATLSFKLILHTGENCISVLENNGYCQNFTTGATALSTKIWGITRSFFAFQGIDSLLIPAGSVVINQNLARHLAIKPGDEITVHYKEISPFPANAPFAPDKSEGGSGVFKVFKIIGPEQSGNFTLGINQIAPMNVFINLEDITENDSHIMKANRILVDNSKNISLKTLKTVLMKSVSPSDIGLSVRMNKSLSECEIISDRIFIDQEIIDEIRKAIPSAQPVITYLANSIRKNDKSTPYSFVAALPPGLYSGILPGKHIIISDWLSKDLNAFVNDTLHLTWFSAAANGLLVEKSEKFAVSRIVRMDSIWSDPSLMPEFPGIAGRTSCSSWDAGVHVNLKSIREKDEDYWNEFKGTPKAFISYSAGKELWGSNFGPATAIRFPGSVTKYKVEEMLEGAFTPEKTGFSINDIRADALKAAGESVDFSTLFLSLGFFIILSCVILLALSVSLFFESRKDQIYTFFALGFTDRWIKKLLFLETSAIALAGVVPGVFAGGVINFLIIYALNSVWSGAVQTNTLSAQISVLPMLTGFLASLLISLVLLRIKVSTFLKSLKKPETGLYESHSKNVNLLLLVISLSVTVLLLSATIIFKNNRISLFFGGGTTLFVTLILFVRHVFMGGFRRNISELLRRNTLSRLYYSFNPSHAVTPVIFIAAGIFAVFITGANKQNINDKMRGPTGGTGGFMLWCESAVPVKYNLTSADGRKEFGLNEPNLRDIEFVQVKRSEGDDASCLNLNHVAAPPLLGLDPSVFIEKGSFSFASEIKSIDGVNPWELLRKSPEHNTIYGIADQTVLQWGLKMAAGDTLLLKSESGQPLAIIIAAGLKSSVFQGYVIIGSDNFDRFYPSVPGSSVFLTTGNPDSTDNYRKILNERFANYGISVLPAIERLASFFQVTNTYLSVFTVLGAFGMLLGVAGMGFILLRNYQHRKREFSLMLATGYTLKRVRRMVITEQTEIISAGILTGIISALVATFPSLTGGSDVPLLFLLIMIVLIFVTGFIAIAASVRVIKNDSLISNLRRE